MRKMEPKQEIFVDMLSVGLRADKFLADKFSEISRSRWQTGFKKKWVKLNGKIIAAAERVKNGDKIDLDGRFWAKEEELLAGPENLDLKIIFENEDLVVVDKPAGLLTHPVAHLRNEKVEGVEATLAGGLVAKYPEMAEAGEEKSRPGIVHRLDKDTSGILVAAKTQKAFKKLKEQFKKHEVLKIYKAVINGELMPRAGVLEKALGRTNRGTKMAVGKGKDLKIAITEYKTLENYFEPATGKKFTLAEIRIKTGRTHQIRVHLADLGHSVVGDKIYGGKEAKKMKGQRLLLHAEVLGFKDMKGKRLEFRADWPEDFKNFIKNLKKYNG